jgi:hypothetical protein
MKQITDIEDIINRLTEEFPDMVPDPSENELTDFQKLLGIIKGKWDGDVFEDQYNSRTSTVVYEVDNEFIYVDLDKTGNNDTNEMAEFWDMEEWDFEAIKDFIQDNYDPYYYEPFSCDSAEEEWMEGYGASALDEENKKLLAKYFNYVSPELSKEITKSITEDRTMGGDAWVKVAGKMLTNLIGNKLVENILDDYCNTINPAMVNATAIDIRKEWDSILTKKGATSWFTSFTEFTIPLKEMVYTYYKQNRQKNGDTLEEMISYVTEDIGQAFGNINEWFWESDYYEEFQESYNKDAKYTIERFISKIEDMEEYDTDYYNKLSVINDKLSKAGIGMDQKLKPADAPYNLEIIELNTEDLKLRVRVLPNSGNVTGHNWGTYKIITMDVDELLNKMYNPELTTTNSNQKNIFPNPKEYMSMTYEEIQRLNENKLIETDRDLEINKFVKFCKDELDINELPPVTLRYDKEGGVEHSKIDTTAYQSKTQGVHVYVKDRALVDVLRSLAHELVHHHQLERDEDYYWKHIEDNPGIQSGTDLEDEANARAGSLIKDWGLVHGNKQIYEQFNKLEDKTEELEEDLENWAYDGESIGPIKEDDGLNDMVYIEKPKPKHLKRMEKDWGTLTGFPIGSFMNTPPPENESNETEEEIKHLDSILVDNDFVNSADDVDEHFKKFLESKDLDYPLDLIKKYMTGVRTIILKLKYHYNRPRPGQVADAKGLDFNMKKLKSATTPSYPSGHATQGRFIGKLLADLYPEHREQLIKVGDDIAFSRNMAKVHYPSDTKFGQKLGDVLYDYVSKEKVLKEGVEYEPLTQQEVSILNQIARKFTHPELKTIADIDRYQVPSEIADKFASIIKLFGISDTSQAEGWEYGRIYAKWIIDNWDGHVGTINAPDFTGFLTKDAKKAYLDEYNVQGNEDVWEMAYRQGTIGMWGFDEDDVRDTAEDSFWDYEPDMETFDWGDSETQSFDIADVDKTGNELRLTEQTIDVSEIPDEDLSPELEVGDRIYAWDLKRDSVLPFDTDVGPDQVIGNVVSIEMQWKGMEGRREFPKPDVPYIYYDVETMKGENVAIYPEDKYIKLPKKQLNEEEVEDLETQALRFIRPIDIEKALSQKEIQKVLKSLGLKYDMFSSLDINLEQDMVDDIRNQIRFDNFYKRMMAASDIRGGTWEGLFAGLFNGKVVAGNTGVGKADVTTSEGGWSLKFVGNKNESPTLGSLKTQLQQVKEEGLVPEDATIYEIFNTPDSQTSSELFEVKHKILDSAFQNVDFIAVAYPIPQQNTIIMHFTDMGNLKEMIIDSENPPVNKPKSGPEALGELRLSTRGWKSWAFLQITFPEVTPEKYQEYLKKYPREKEIEGVFGKYGEKIPPEVLQYLRKNPKSVIDRLQKIRGYDKYFTEQFIDSAEYLTQNANDRLKSFKKYLTEACDIKDVPTTIGFIPREAWEDGLKDIFSRCWFYKTSKGIDGAFGSLADKTLESFPPEDYPEMVEIIGEIYEVSEEVYKYLFPPQEEEVKYSLSNLVQDDAAEILYNDVKELVEEAEKTENTLEMSTEEEHLDDLEGILNRIDLILNIFTSSVGSPLERTLGFRRRGE